MEKIKDEDAASQAADEYLETLEYEDIKTDDKLFAAFLAGAEWAEKQINN